MTVSEVTSGAVLTVVANLEAASEVAKTNRFYNKFRNTGLQTFSLMYILEMLGLYNAIKMIYSNNKSLFCRPLQWRGTGTRMVSL